MEVQNNKKNSLLLALLLSALVAAVGAVVWGLIYSSGWFVSFISYFTAIGMFWVYEKFYKVTKFTYIWSFLLINVLNILASFLAIIITVSNQLSLPFGEVLQVVLENFGELAGPLMRDCLLGIVFSIAGIVSCISARKKKAKQQGSSASSVVVVDDQPVGTNYQEQQYTQYNNAQEQQEKKDNPYNENY